MYTHPSVVKILTVIFIKFVNKTSSYVAIAIYI